MPAPIPNLDQLRKTPLMTAFVPSALVFMTFTCGRPEGS